MPKTRKRPVQPEDVYALRTVVDPQISPDGRFAAYTLSWNDKDKDEVCSAIYRAPLDGKSPARRFTWGKNDNSPRWSPDGRFLAFVSNRGEKSQIFLAPLDGGEPFPITHAKFGVSQPCWSPDGKQMAFTARVGDYKETKDRGPVEKAAPRVIRDLAYKLDGIGFFDQRRLHIFTVDVGSGVEKQITDGDFNDRQPCWSPDGRSIAFVSDRRRGRHQYHWRGDVWVAPAAGGRPRKLTPSTGGVTGPVYSPDGRWIAFIGQEGDEADTSRNPQLMIVPAQGGEAPRSVSAALDRPVTGPVPKGGQTFDWLPGGRSLVFLAADQGAMVLYRADIRSGSVEKALGGDRHIQSLSLSPEGGRVAFSAAWLSAPGEIYVAGFDGKTPERNLSRANDELLGSVEFARPRRIKYKARDGLEIETFVLVPPNYKKGKPLPTILEIHGGPHSFHPSIPRMLAFQAMAAAGYAVTLPNPRGSGSYGEAFARGCVEDWGGQDFLDIMTGVDELVKRGIADPDRLYVSGYSFGGFMTTWTVGHTNRFRAAVIGAPVSDQASMFGTTDIPRFNAFELGALPFDAPERSWQRSPVAYLPNVQTPVLLTHNEGDLRCPMGQSEEIFHGLKMLGKEVEFVRYPGGSHVSNAPSQLVDRTRRIIDWFEGHAPSRAKKKRGG